MFSTEPGEREGMAANVFRGSAAPFLPNNTVVKGLCTTPEGIYIHILDGVGNS